MLRRTVVAGCILLLPTIYLVAESVRLENEYRPGEQYRAIGTNRQDLFQNNQFIGSLEELVRLQIEVQDVEPDGGATLHAIYQMASTGDTVGEPFQLDREFDITFHQSRYGSMIVDDSEFVPQVRDLPLFPERNLSVGDQWRAPAIEVYDLRAGFEIPDPVRVPILVDYTLSDIERKQDGDIAVIDAAYDVYFTSPRGTHLASKIRLITGTFRQRLYWNLDWGRLQIYEETFEHFIQLSDGTTFLFSGSADGQVLDAPPMDRVRMERDIQARLREESVENTTVRSTEEGVTIAIEDIRFHPDSAELIPTEIEKLDFIGRILQNYPERDILITGHTALAGTVEGRQILSEERAAAVGEYFVSRGIRNRTHLIYRGVGATEPVADNSTEEGMRRNRRVEITILEN